MRVRCGACRRGWRNKVQVRAGVSVCVCARAALRRGSSACARPSCRADDPMGASAARVCVCLCVTVHTRAAVAAVAAVAARRCFLPAAVASARGQRFMTGGIKPYTPLQAAIDAVAKGSGRKFVERLLPPPTLFVPVPLSRPASCGSVVSRSHSIHVTPAFGFRVPRFGFRV